MKKSTLIILFLLVSSHIVLAQKTERHYLSGVDAKRTVDWDFFCTDGRNSGTWAKIAVPSNWKLFFNIAPRPIIDYPSPQKAKVEHINGDWYQLVPNDEFTLNIHESIEVFYRGKEGVIKESDGPLGVYFVFYDDDGLKNEIISNQIFI